MKNIFYQYRQESCLAVIIVLLISIMGSFAPGFFTLQNWLDLLEGRMLLFIFAFGLLVTLISGGIDISFPIIASISQYITLLALNSMGGGNWLFGLLFSMLVGFTLGCINALLIYYLNVFSIIVTIATQSIFFGLLMAFTKGTSIYNLPQWLAEEAPLIHFGSAPNEGLSIPLLSIFVVMLITSIILGRFSIGMQVYALGGNKEGLRRIGLSIPKLMVFAYGYLGALSGFAGLIQVYRVKEVVPKALYGSELNVLAAVVLGGASLMGGKGSVTGAFLGVLLLAIIQNLMVLLGVSSYIFQLLVGCIILFAVVVTHIQPKSKLGVSHV